MRNAQQIPYIGSSRVVVMTRISQLALSFGSEDKHPFQLTLYCLNNPPALP